jgi:hypothetical protein
LENLERGYAVFENALKGGARGRILVERSCRVESLGYRSKEESFSDRER